MRGVFAILGLLSAGGCQMWPPATPALPQRNSVVLDQLVVYTDFKLPQQHRLLGELTALRADLSTRLGLPVSDEPIHVYLFESADEFKAFMKRNHPRFPVRRAFFVETDTRLAVYAYWGDRVAEDLRHEVSHGYLHSLAPGIPLWLDEGLAEYFEVPRGREGLNRPHVEQLLARINAGLWRPDLARLEALGHVAEMTQADYAESWAWVHFLLTTSPDTYRLLHDHLQSLRATGRAEPLSAALARMYDDPAAVLLKHLATLEGHRSS